jgi:metal-dependent amidase/aminoacylase/carboxypeptidase family protein
VLPAPAVGRVGSSDFGNVSQVLPAIHPYVAIVPEGVSAHTPEFAAAAASPEGLRGLRLAATCLAATAADLLADPELLAAARADFGAPTPAGGTA